MDDLIIDLIDNRQFDEELGSMSNNPENTDLKIKDIKDKLYQQVLQNLSVEIDVWPYLYRRCLIVLFVLLICMLFSIVY